MDAVRAPNTEPIPGYRLIEPLGSGGFGEVWKCEAPGGLFKAIKFVHGGGDGLFNDAAGAQQELRALQHVKTIRHPFLLSMDRVEHIDGELVIVMELADRSLHDLLQERRAAGLPGVPRAELLPYLKETAEVLDLMNQEYGLQHLDVKPRNLFLVGRHVKVADFGLVNSLAELYAGGRQAVQLTAFTPRYAAPETFLGQITIFTDQYSLAIAYHELLTGALPFTGKNIRQLAFQHVQSEPDLSQLPDADRPIVARALAKEPRARYATCTEFVEALAGERAVPAAATPVPRRARSNTTSDIYIGDLGHTSPVPKDVGAALTPSGEPPAAPPAARTGDPLAGFQFLECVARASVGETWTAKSSDGRPCLVRYVFGFNDDGGTLDRLRSLRHEALAPVEIVSADSNRLALISDAVGDPLASRLKECQAAGEPGVPRPELLGRLREAAEALDDLYQTHRLRHLSLTPRQLLVSDGRLRLLDFGLVELIWIPAGVQAGALHARYAAPELFDGGVSPSCDAYSLALIFQELLTGVHPFRNLNQRQMVNPRLRGSPDLRLASAADRDVLARALHPEAQRRFQTCTELVAALEGVQAGAVVSHAAPTTETRSLPPASTRSVLTDSARSQAIQAIRQLAAEAVGDFEVLTARGARYRLRPGRVIEHDGCTRLPPGEVKQRLDDFRRQWQAEAASPDGRRFTFTAAPTAAGWRRWLGKLPALRVRVHAPAGEARIAVQIEPCRCGPADADRLLGEFGLELLDSLRTHLELMPERRRYERFPLVRTVRVLPVDGEGQTGTEIVSQTWDVSLGGMGLYLPCKPSFEVFLIQTTEGLEASLPARAVRVRPCPDGRFDVGACFLDGEEEAVL